MQRALGGGSPSKKSPRSESRNQHPLPPPQLTKLKKKKNPITSKEESTLPPCGFCSQKQHLLVRPVAPAPPNPHPQFQQAPQDTAGAAVAARPRLAQAPGFGHSARTPRRRQLQARAHGGATPPPPTGHPTPPAASCAPAVATPEIAAQWLQK